MIITDIPFAGQLAELNAPILSDPARPALLLPVRLETRLFAQPDGGVELRVRVFPDAVHLDTHDPRLTDEEFASGTAFHQAVEASQDVEARILAWQQLVERYDVPRAAWIARTLERPGATQASNGQPAVDRRPAGWTRPAIVRALPNRWMLLGYRDGRLLVHETGAPIVEPLYAGPGSMADDAEKDGLGWLNDFTQAESKGMALRARLPGPIGTVRLDFLVVIGLRATPQDAEELAGLLRAHHYTDGLAYVRPGTPSNNTTEERSGYDSRDAPHRRSYVIEREPPAIRRDDGCDADALATALGLEFEQADLNRLQNAGTRFAAQAAHMNTALWPTTWGYYLVQMLGVGGTEANPLEDGDIAWLRRHFIEHVRAAGPLPALRIGRQPYGIVPVSSLDLWRASPLANPEPEREFALCQWLLKLRSVWRRKVSRIPRLGATDPGDDPSAAMGKDMAAVMSMEGLSSRYAIRNLMGRQYVEHLLVYLTADFFADVWDVDPQSPQEKAAVLRGRMAKRRALAQWWQEQERQAGLPLQALGMSLRPRLSRGVYGPRVAGLTGPLVQEDRGDTLKPNYIGALLEAQDLSVVLFDALQDPPPRALLYLLLRHAMLLQYAAVGERLLSLTPAQRRERELCHLPADQSTLTIEQQWRTPIHPPSLQQPVPLANYLLQGALPDNPLGVPADPALQSVREFRASLGELAALPPSTLEQLMCGTLDLCSHRLDAWITSLATARMRQMRHAEPEGLLLGGYGWVTNLAAASPEGAPPPGETDPLVRPRANPGFVHSPSLSQACTAAVLRSGHLAHAEVEALSVDLSSERVRRATYILEGVRQGQTLGALLGYRFERLLQEGGRAQFIPTFRHLAPAGAGQRADGKAEPLPSDVAAVASAADGLALLKRLLAARSASPPQWSADTIPFGLSVESPGLGLPPADGPDAIPIMAALTALEDDVDAVADSLLAETVHQFIRGNPLRVTGTVEAVAAGDAPIPELEVVRTPRTGVALTHRVLIAWSGDPALPAGWVSPAYPQRAIAEPRLNAWLGKLLGSAAGVRCTVECVDAATGAALDTRRVYLHELRLAPLDFLYAVPGAPGGQAAEIEQRILYTLQRRPDAFPPGSVLRLDGARRPDFKPGELSYQEFDELLRAVRDLVMGARPLEPEDLEAPHRTSAWVIDVADLERRVTLVSPWLLRVPRELRVLLARPDVADLDVLRSVMLRAAGFGVPGAIPMSAKGTTAADRDTLLAQAASIRGEIERRVESFTALDAGFVAATATVESRRARVHAQLRAMFGAAFQVLPRMTAADPAELRLALGDSTQVQDGDPYAALTWLLRMARVREGAARLNRALGYSEALGRGEKAAFRIAQLPYAETDRWVGLPLEPGRPLPGGKLSLAVQSSVPIDLSQPLGGLMVDEWVEVVPNPSETTAIAFQYEAPNAVPPQAMLLAVPPDPSSPWTVGSLQQVVLEALDLARLRAVDGDALDELAHYLPATFMAFNTSPGDTVSTDFSRMR